MKNNTTAIILAMNLAWGDLQRNHPDLPDVMIVVGRKRQKAEHKQYAHHCADTWKQTGEDEKLSEVVIFAEHLIEGPEDALQHLIHEAAHELARARDIKDTSNRGRFHNRKFAALAGELGLQPPESSGGPTLGFSSCKITKSTCERYHAAVERIREASNTYVLPPPEEAPKPKKATIKAWCECPEDEPSASINWTKALAKRQEAYGVPPVLCGICRQAYVPEEGEDNE